MGIAHVDDVESVELAAGHLKGRWSFLGQAAGSVGVGLSRIELPAGGWSTPAHDHGVEEELFYVRSGRGLSWHKGETFEIAGWDSRLDTMGDSGLAPKNLRRSSWERAMAPASTP